MQDTLSLRNTYIYSLQSMLIPAMMLWIYGHSVKSTYCSFITIRWTHCAGRLYSLFSSFPSIFWPLSFPYTSYRLCKRLQILGQRSTPRFSGQLIYASQSETSVQGSATDWLYSPPAVNHSVMETSEKGSQVKLKFRGSKSGRPTDDLLWSSGRPTAILGVRMPGRPLNLHAVVLWYSNERLDTNNVH